MAGQYNMQHKGHDQVALKLSEEIKRRLNSGYV
jgi:hypothetical protein